MQMHTGIFQGFSISDFGLNLFPIFPYFRYDEQWNSVKRFQNKIPRETTPTL